MRRGAYLQATRLIVKSCRMLSRFGVLTVLLAIASAPVAEAQFGYHFGRNKIQYNAFEWRVLKTEHFDVYYYPEEEQHLDEVVAFAEDAYRKTARKMNHELSERMPDLRLLNSGQRIAPFFLWGRNKLPVACR